MKKNLLLLLLAGAMLAGCESEFSFVPRKGGKYVPFEEETDEEEAAEQGEIITCTYYIYLSYSHTTKHDELLDKDVSSPIDIIRDVNMFAPLATDAAAAARIALYDTKEELIDIAADQGFVIDDTFDKFLGFSDKTVCLDEEGLWNFATDTKQSAIINLYGVWVSE